MDYAALSPLTGERDDFHPLSIFARLLGEREIQFEEVEDSSAEGLWTTLAFDTHDSDLYLFWYAELEELRLDISFQLKVPPRYLERMAKLFLVLNRELPFGFFTCTFDNSPIFTVQVPLLDGTLGKKQAARILDCAAEQAVMFFPALQFCLWGGKSPEEAVALALLHVAGEA